MFFNVFHGRHEAVELLKGLRRASLKGAMDLQQVQIMKDDHDLEEDIT